MPRERLRVLTWHVHGSYLAYLAHCGHDLYLPVGPKANGYAGRTDSFDWPENVHEVPVEQVRSLPLDVILFQSRRHWEVDQHEILSEAQRHLPRIFLEHDPPRESPTETRHVVDDPDVLLVHVTHFNELMWNSGRTPTRVIEHGVAVPADVEYDGHIPSGIVVVNGLNWRGRRLGSDVFQRARREVPLVLVGMESLELGGQGEVPPRELARTMAGYRFFFNPIRWTSLGLSVLEAMSVGLPVVGLATTELVDVVEDGVSGFLSTDIDVLVDRMRQLLDDPALARRLGSETRRTAHSRFGIERFAAD